jgi:hypothetical protein
MRFLADECCDFAAVRALRAAGHDVSAASEFQQRSVDQQLMELAHAEGRILLTEDSVTRVVVEMGSSLAGSFVVVRPGSIRISKTPDAGLRGDKD